MNSLSKTWSLKIPEEWIKIRTIDMHTGGEPLRIIIDGLPEIKGNTILEKRRFFKENLDYIRTGLMFEPRGHADMYGAVVTEPISSDADFGTFFLHNEGYSTMCGHAIIALTKFVLESGLIVKSNENPELIIDAPPGKIYSKAIIENQLVKKTQFKNVPSFVLMHNECIYVDGIGEVKLDVAFGGAFYALVEAEQLDLELNAENYNQLIDYGKRIKQVVMNNYRITHPFEEDLSFLYGTIFTGRPSNLTNHSRNVCIFADGEVDRSATGSGVSARAALQFSRGELNLNESITIESILGTTMDVRVVEETNFGSHKAIIPEVSGTAEFAGKNEFWFNPNDPLKNGFIFR